MGSHAEHLGVKESQVLHVLVVELKYFPMGQREQAPVAERMPLQVQDPLTRVKNGLQSVHVDALLHVLQELEQAKQTPFDK